MQIDKKFYCYSKRLKNALVCNGFRYIETGMNLKTRKPFWVFIGSDILNYYKTTIYQKERDNF